MEGLRNGDNRAYEYLYKIIYKPLIGCAKKMTYGKEEAEEIVCNAFVKLYNNISDIQSYNHVRSWMYKCVKNAAIDLLEHKKIVRQHEKYVVHLNEVESFDVYEMEILRNSILVRLMEQVDSLPVARKAAVYAFMNDKRSYNARGSCAGKSSFEAAEILGVARQTALNNYSRAIRSLKTKKKEILGL